jgi:hypothetical protein
MEKLRFKSLSSDAGIFIYQDKDGRFVIVLIYVDDTIFTGPHTALTEQLKGEVMKIWETRDLGDLTDFLRMRITRHGSKISIDQCAYL